MAMICQPCGKHFSGIISYNQHIESEKHKRKVSLNLLQGRNAEQPNVILKPANGPNGIPCSACNIAFDSFEYFQRHTLTVEHANNVSKMVQDAVDSNIATVSSTSNEHATNDHVSKNTARAFNDETDIILPSMSSFTASYSVCATCNKQFSGQEPYRQHLESAGHKKKVEMENYISAAGANQNILNRFACELCKKVFSGQIPLEQHLVSEVHRKKLQNIQLLEQVKVNKGFKCNSGECNSTILNNAKTGDDEFKDMDINSLWFCQACLTQCSGPIPYKQHVDGDAHWKNIRKLELLKSSNASECKPMDISVRLLNTINTNRTVVPQPVLLPEVNKSSQDMEMDVLLPEAMQNILVMSSDEINLKEFLPEQKIDFDNCGPKETNDEKSMSHGSFEESPINEKKIDLFGECKLCSVQLISKEHALSHYESMEHFNRRWRSS